MGEKEVLFDALSTIITSYDEYRDDRPTGRPSPSVKSSSSTETRVSRRGRARERRRQGKAREEQEDKGGPEGPLRED